MPWFLLLPAVMLLAAGPAEGARPPTLDEVLSIALRDNPDLREAELALDEARADAHSAGAWPNPVYAVSPGNPNQYSAGLPLDLGPQRHYRVNAARLGTDAAARDVDDVMQQIAFGVRQSFFDLLLADSLQVLAATEEDIVRRVVATDSLRVRTGEIAESALARSSLELARVQSIYAHARTAVHSARLDLQTLMGVLRPDTAFTVTGELRYAPLAELPDSLEALALGHRADLRAAERRVDQSRALENLARSSILPIPTLSLVHQTLPFESGGTEALGLSVTVPLFDWNGGERRRARDAFEIARTESGRVRTRTTTGVAIAVDQFVAARELASRYETGLLDQAHRGLEAARFAYAHGSGSLLDFLDALRAYGQTRSDYYNAVHDYWVSAYALSRAAGVNLVR